MNVSRRQTLSLVLLFLPSALLAAPEAARREKPRKPAPTPVWAPASLTAGQAFVITLLPEKKSIVGQNQTFRLPGNNGDLRLELRGLVLDGGHLTADAIVSLTKMNVLVSNVRLEIEEVREVAHGASSSAEGKAGSLLPATARETLVFPEASVWTDDISKAFDVSPILPAPGTELVTVLGRVHGLAVPVSEILEGAPISTAADLDPFGLLHVADASQGRILAFPRADSPREIGRVDGPARSLAIHPRTGDIYVVVAGESKIRILATSRRRQGEIEAGAPVGPIRFSPAGRLWAATGTTLLEFEDGGIVQKVGGFPAGTTGIRSFDVARDGTLWVTVGKGAHGALFRVQPGGAPEETAGLPEDLDPVACRVDREGLLWVAGIPPEKGGSLVLGLDPRTKMKVLYRLNTPPPETPFSRRMIPKWFRPIDLVVDKDQKIWVVGADLPPSGEVPALVVLRPF